ncbi:MAG: hypothetical protein RH981_10920 [Arenibacter sp.]|jgi:hypothetical protein
MDKREMRKYLEGGDLRTIGGVKFLVPLIRDQKDFDILFRYMYSKDRPIVMRAADTVEKSNLRHPEYLASHKSDLLGLLQSAKDKELKWHLSLLVSRLPLTDHELEIVLAKLKEWASDPSESRIVRVNALQALCDIKDHEPRLEKDFRILIGKLQKEEIASINARIRNLKIG